VDPATTQIVFRFDRPMRSSYTVMLGPKGRDAFPEGTPAWDATRTIFVQTVKLKPNGTYEYSLNNDQTAGFVSEEGVPLKPFAVKFTTGPGR
jgi:hypothetical protein